MSDNTAIEWTDSTWNPVSGCTKVSPGCDHCYAETFAERWRGTPGHHFENGFDVTLRPEKLALPLRWKKPRRVFVNSMSDLFHVDIPDEFIAQVFITMAKAPQHTFQILTKRHGRMRSLIGDDFSGGHRLMESLSAEEDAQVLYDAPWPLPNVWLGVSVENQQWANIRIPALLETSAAVRWISAEPLLGPIDLGNVGPDPGFDSLLSHPHLSWVVAGGESGPGARPMHPDWARSLRDQCQTGGVAFLFKQHGEWQPLGPLYGDLEDTDESHMEAVHLEVVEHKRVIELESSGYIAEGHQPGDSRTWLMARVGKKAAGRELDGRTWDEFPGVHRQAVIV